MDFPELILILLVALIVLGPEKTIELAGKLGELLRKVRETWDELRYQLYLEEINRKVMEKSKNLEEGVKTGEVLENAAKLTEESNSLEGKTKTEEVLEDEPRTSQDATDGTSEGTKTKAD
ncbi:MAG: twin-arginine translocase TatA/TatE family subunit [Thermocrinis sp.]|nr:twin-arginine translocase TatA/TatE family subunit [Thermocrinis sp.]